MKKYLIVLFAGLVLSLAPAPAMAQQEDAGLIAMMTQASAVCNPCLQSCLPIGIPVNSVDYGFLMAYYDAWWWANAATIEDWAGYYIFFF
jgi:hypothetical protein